jgi:hypothetical protein
MKLYIKVLGLAYERIDAHKHNCILFSKEYEKLDVCP